MQRQRPTLVKTSEKPCLGSTLHNILKGANCRGQLQTRQWFSDHQHTPPPPPPHHTTNTFPGVSASLPQSFDHGFIGPYSDGSAKTCHGATHHEDKSAGRGPIPQMIATKRSGPNQDTRNHDTQDPDDTRVRVDLHVHGQWSADAIGDLDALARVGIRKSLQGLALTEHNTTRHHGPIKKWNRENRDGPFVFYPGIEVSTEQGHLLALGVQEEIPARLGIEETLDLVTDAGGIAVPAHPHRRWTGIGPRILDRLAHRVLLVETHNAQETPKSNKRTQGFAQRHGLKGTGGSDAHQVHDVGNAYTVLDGPARDLDALLDRLRRGRVEGAGGHTRWLTRARQRARIAVRFSTFRYP